MNITIKQPKNYQDLEAYKKKPLDCTWDNNKKEFTFNANTSTNKKSWRLVYKENKVIDLFESSGVTMTIWDLFEGTEKACLAKIDELKLDYVSEKDVSITI